MFFMPWYSEQLLSAMNVKLGFNNWKKKERELYELIMLMKYDYLFIISHPICHSSKSQMGYFRNESEW